MFDLYEWGDDLPTPQRATSAVVATDAHKPTNENPDGDDGFEVVRFTDIWDRHVIREGKVLRSTTSAEHANPFLGKLPAVTLYLVAYPDDSGKETFDVIWVSRLVKTKPRP